MFKVIIIEDDTLLSDLLSNLIGNRKDWEISATTGDGLEGMKLAEKNKPDMLVCDLKLPGLNGIEIIERLKSQQPTIRILALSGFFNLGTIKRVMMAKADGIIEKSAGLEELEKALDAVAKDGCYYSPQILRQMPQLMHATDCDENLAGLTAREREVLQLIAEGNTAKETAAKLGISARTVDVHRTHIMQKLNVHNVAGLTRLAISFGLVETPGQL